VGSSERKECRQNGTRMVNSMNVWHHTSPQSHDHLLHQFGMPVIGLLGYLIGLFASLGDDLRPLLPWIKMQSK